jgi:hypothetical protein
MVSSPRYPEAVLSGECRFLGHFNGCDLYFVQEHGVAATALVKRPEQPVPDLLFVDVPLMVGPEGEAHHVARFLATRWGYLPTTDFTW